MPKDKDLKRLVRRRMEKTGESYTAARAQLLSSSYDPSGPPAEYETLAGMSDDAVRNATGKDWTEWTSLLDGADAANLPHPDIAALAGAEPGVSGWWAQTVAVAYERFRGLRDVGQRRGGGYDVNKSKTIPVPVSALFRAFEDLETRARWLPDTSVTIRTATVDKSLRMRLADDTPLDAYFTSKGEAKSAVSLQHRGLPDKATAERMKAFWGERLTALASVVAAD